MGLILVTPPAAEPLDRTELKNSHVRVTGTDDDTYIDGLIAAARIVTETQTGRSLITQTWQANFEGFPSWRVLTLEKSPIQSITHIKYYDADDVLQTLDSSLYTLDATVNPARIVLNYEGSWPLTYSRADAVQITYDAGYGDDRTDIPADLIHAMRFLVAHWYAQREPVRFGNVQVEVPMTYEYLVGPYRIYT